MMKVSIQYFLFNPASTFQSIHRERLQIRAARHCLCAGTGNGNGAGRALYKSRKFPARGIAGEDLAQPPPQQGNITRPQTGEARHFTHKFARMAHPPFQSLQAPAVDRGGKTGKTPLTLCLVLENQTKTGQDPGKLAKPNQTNLK